MSMEVERILLLAWLCSSLPTINGQSCSDNGKTFTNSSGSITSNSFGSSSYSNNANCAWYIMPSGAASVTLSFSAFRTEQSRDYVRVYSCITSSCRTRTELSGSPFSGSSIPNNITSSTGKMMIEFASDSRIAFSGFLATYTSTVCLTGQYADSYGA
jgi:hypothetical protein